MDKRVKDLTGLKVHLLTVIEYAGKGNGTRPRCKWKCLCECGNFKVLSTDTLTAATTKSCGCLKSPPHDKYILKLQKRLVYYCEKTETCWLWKGFLTYQGYGRTTIKNVSIASHRAAWLAWKGKIKKGEFVLHKCDNRACINPDHLFLGNQLDNITDMRLKNRQRYAKGEDSGNSVLTVEQVKEIISLKGIESSYSICDRFNCAASTIRAIWSKRSWKHIP